MPLYVQSAKRKNGSGPINTLCLSWVSLWLICFAVPGFLPEAQAQGESDEVPYGKIQAYTLEVFNHLRITVPAPATNTPAPCRINFVSVGAPVSTQQTVQVTSATALSRPASIPPVYLIVNAAESFRQDARTQSALTLRRSTTEYNPVSSRGQVNVSLGARGVVATSVPIRIGTQWPLMPPGRHDVARESFSVFGSTSQRRSVESASPSPVAIVMNQNQNHSFVRRIALRSDLMPSTGTLGIANAAAERRGSISVVLGKESRLPEFASAHVLFRGSAIPVSERAGFALQSRPSPPAGSSEAWRVVYSGPSNMLNNAIGSLRLKADSPTGLSGYGPSTVHIVAFEGHRGPVMSEGAKDARPFQLAMNSGTLNGPGAMTGAQAQGLKGVTAGVEMKLVASDYWRPEGGIQVLRSWTNQLLAGGIGPVKVDETIGAIHVESNGMALSALNPVEIATAPLQPGATVMPPIRMALSLSLAATGVMSHAVSMSFVPESDLAGPANAVQLAFASSESKGTMTDVPILTYRPAEALEASLLESVSLGLNTSNDHPSMAWVSLVMPVNAEVMPASRLDLGQGIVSLNPLIFDQRPAAEEIRLVPALTSQESVGVLRPVRLMTEHEATGVEPKVLTVPILIFSGHDREDTPATAKALAPFGLNLNSGGISVSAESFVLKVPKPSASPGATVFQIPFRSAAPLICPPLNLRVTTLMMPDTSIVDKLMVSNVFEEVKQGKINKRNPELRKRLIGVIRSCPFTQEAYQVFVFILENAGGNTINKRIANLEAWSREFEGGRSAPIVSYYIVYHLYRIKDYDRTIAKIADYRGQFKDYQDRFCMLEALCSIQKNNNTRALAALQRVQEEHPDSSLVPEAIFLTAWIYFQDNNRAEAKAILEELVQKHPDSVSAGKGRQLLADLKGKE